MFQFTSKLPIKQQTHGRMVIPDSDVIENDVRAKSECQAKGCGKKINKKDYAIRGNFCAKCQFGK